MHMMYRSYTFHWLTRDGNIIICILANLYRYQECLLTTPNLTVESLIRRKSFYSYSQNFWAAEISSYTVAHSFLLKHDTKINAELSRK